MIKCSQVEANVEAETARDSVAADRFVVRCGLHRVLYAMNSRASHSRGEKVVARTQRGLELGEVLCPITNANLSSIQKLGNGTIQRVASSEDLAAFKRQSEQTISDATDVQAIINSFGLPMKVIEIERILGGEQFTIYYTATDRIDFRELVKKLASKYHTRIEMRQIGARDEAKLLGDYGDCGNPLCCNTYLNEMPPVSMRMAKLQKATLDPNKISGRCGRLKCCLRYEQDHYEELAKEIPPPGSEILTRDGKARVISVELLAQQMLVATEDNRRVLMTLSDCLSVIKRGAELS